MSSLHLLLIYQPHLEYLNIHIGDAKTSDNHSILPFPALIHLRELHFRTDDSAVRFENLCDLLKYFPNLQSLSLNLTTDDRLFFNGHILQTLVDSLDTFQFSIARFFPPSFEEQSLSTFYTPFWLERKKWFTQCYWHTDGDDTEPDYFHIYSIPYLFDHLDIHQCTNENLLSKERFRAFDRVKRLELSKTSDVNSIPFLKNCPRAQTISLNHIYDDETNYGTDEEEDITDLNDESKFAELIHRSKQSLSLGTIETEVHTTDAAQASSLPVLPHVRNLILLALPDYDLGFFDCLVRVTPNLRRLSVFYDDLLEIMHYPQGNLCRLLQMHLDQLEVRFQFSWLPLNIHKDIAKIMHIFSNLRSLTLSLHAMQKRPLPTAKAILTSLLKHPSNLLCIHINSNSSVCFEQVLRQSGIESLRRWLAASGHSRFQQMDYLQNSVHIELNSSSITLWL